MSLWPVSRAASPTRGAGENRLAALWGSPQPSCKTCLKSTPPPMPFLWLFHLSCLPPGLHVYPTQSSGSKGHLLLGAFPRSSPFLRLPDNSVHLYLSDGISPILLVLSLRDRRGSSVTRWCPRSPTQPLFPAPSCCTCLLSTLQMCV